MAETSTLLMCRMRKCTEGSNPSSSAINPSRVLQHHPQNSLPDLANARVFLKLPPKLSKTFRLHPRLFDGIIGGTKRHFLPRQWLDGTNRRFSPMRKTPAKRLHECKKQAHRIGRQDGKAHRQTPQAHRRWRHVLARSPKREQILEDGHPH